MSCTRWACTCRSMTSAPATPRSRRCSSSPTRWPPERPEAGSATPGLPGRALLAVAADGGRGPVLVLSRALRGGAHRLLRLLRQRPESGAGGLLESGDHLAQAVGAGQRGAGSDERRQHVAPFAAAEDAVERHVHL